MVTNNEKWPGMDPKWKSGRKAHLKNQQRWYDTFRPFRMGDLEHFATAGAFPREITGVDWTKYKRWEWCLSISLGVFGLLREFEIDSNAQREQRFDYQAAASAYSAVRLSQMIDLHVHVKAPERLGSPLSSMDIHLLPCTALGVIIGDPSALPLVRLLAAAARRGWYRFDDRFPVFLFLLLLMADYLQEEMPPGVAALLGESPLAALLAQWDDPQPGNLVPLCMAACDFHTRRCVSTAGMEFSTGKWRYTPVEIMLLMRLRTLRGLDNPVFEHPLWTSVFSSVRAGVPVAPDDLIQRLEQRMRADGYDEEFIIRATLEY
jgi:hypothetical protein